MRRQVNYTWRRDHTLPCASLVMRASRVRWNLLASAHPVHSLLLRIAARASGYVLRQRAAFSVSDFNAADFSGVDAPDASWTAVGSSPRLLGCLSWIDVRTARAACCGEGFMG
jgi:hypothetical protein